jgi:hypothetical protein
VPRVPLLALLAGAAVGGCASGSALPPDQSCLSVLRSRGVEFTEGPSLKGVRTPVTIDGERFAPRLHARAGRPAEMDCQLAVALNDAQPIFRSMGITQLDFSGAYDYRNRRHSSKLSAHANGLAIDVHVFHTGARDYAVARNFERRPGSWHALEMGKGDLRACIANPRTAGGRTLRGLACRLRFENAFRIILTPDDNYDHHDHFHLEAPPDYTNWVTLSGPPAPSS